RWLRYLAVELQHIKPTVTIDQVNQAAIINIGVIGLRAGFAAAGFRDVPAHFLRRRGIGDVDDAQAAREPRAVQQRIAAFPVFLELVRAETARGGAAPWAVEFADFEQRYRLDVGEIGDVEYPQAAVRAAAAARHFFG